MLRWAEHVARTDATTYSYRIFVGKPLAEHPLEISERKLERNINMAFSRRTERPGGSVSYLMAGFGVSCVEPSDSTTTLLVSNRHYTTLTYTASHHHHYINISPHCHHHQHYDPLYNRYHMWNLRFSWKWGWWCSGFWSHADSSVD
jgi:hypothetical protein